MPLFDPSDPVQSALNTAQQVTQLPGGGTSTPIDPMRRELTPLGLYSHAADALRTTVKQLKGTWQQYRAALLKAGVRPDELKWSGADEKFNGRTVTREQLKKHFDTALPKIQERVNTPGEPDEDGLTDSGTAQYGEYTLPGSKNYREMLLHLPENKTKAGVGMGLAPGALDTSNHYSSHWQDTPNVLAHIRMSDRPYTAGGYQWSNGKSGNTSSLFPTREAAEKYAETLPPETRKALRLELTNKGRKALHVEELQSDWAQQARERGFKNPLTPEEHRQGQVYAQRGAQNLSPEELAHWHELTNRYHADQEALPHGPYVDSTSKWLDLALKRVLSEAARGNYDRVLLTPGEEQAKRYDLSKHVDKLNLTPNGRLGEAITGYRVNGFKDNDPIFEHHIKHEDELPAVVGKEMAEKLLRGRNQHGAATVAGQDMRVGGEGMKAFYDQIVPRALEKLARRHDPEAQVQLHSHVLNKPIDVGHLQHEHGLAPGVWETLAPERRRAQIAYYERNHPDAKVGTRLHSLEITPKMRESIRKGQPAFASGGAVDEPPQGDVDTTPGVDASGSISRNVHATEHGELHTYDEMSDTRSKRAAGGRSEHGHVVNDDGSPKVVYHGTRRKFDTFERSRGGEFGSGIYFAPHPETAEMFGSFHQGPDPVRVVKAHLRLSNPLYTNDRNVPRGAGVAKLIRQGYDGVIGTTPNGDTQYVAFHPEQVRVLNDDRSKRAAGGRAQPTEAQKAAGNYPKERVNFQGIPISIETPKGAERTGRNKRTGKQWSVRMPADYGYVRGTEGADGDHVDVYMGDDHKSPIAFIVNQNDHRSRRFDEHKIILGVRSERAARDLYCAGFSDGHGPRRLGSMEPVSIEALKTWLSERHKTSKVARASDIVDHALKIAARAAA